MQICHVLFLFIYLFFCISAHSSNERISWIHANSAVILLTMTSAGLRGETRKFFLLCHDADVTALSF